MNLKSGPNSFEKSRVCHAGLDPASRRSDYLADTLLSGFRVVARNDNSQASFYREGVLSN